MRWGHFSEIYYYNLNLTFAMIALSVQQKLYRETLEEKKDLQNKLEEIRNRVRYFHSEIESQTNARDSRISYYEKLAADATSLSVRIFARKAVEETLKVYANEIMKLEKLTIESIVNSFQYEETLQKTLEDVEARISGIEGAMSSFKNEAFAEEVSGYFT